MQKVYLDNAATTPMKKEVIDVMTSMYGNHFGNPSSTHAFGREAKGILEMSRRNIAKLLGAKPSEIIFTSCATEADNFAIRQSVESLGVKRIISSKIEHHAVSYTVNQMAKLHGVEVVWLPTLAEGYPDISELEELLKEDKKTLVSIMYVNNELGNINNIQKIGSLCKQYGAVFHSDMVQGIAHLPVNFSELDVDFSACSAHKFHGPKGAGILFRRNELVVEPMMVGGAQEREVRAGTENVVQIAAMEKALELAVNNLEEEMIHVKELRDYMWDNLQKIVPGVSLNTDYDNSIPTVLNVRFPQMKNQGILLFSLDLRGVACSGGSACSSGSVSQSDVLSAMGVPNDSPSVRFSFSSLNTKEEIDYVLEQIKDLIK